MPPDDQPKEAGTGENLSVSTEEEGVDTVKAVSKVFDSVMNHSEAEPWGSTLKPCLVENILKTNTVPRTSVSHVEETVKEVVIVIKLTKNSVEEVIFIVKLTKDVGHVKGG